MGSRIQFYLAHIGEDWRGTTCILWSRLDAEAKFDFDQIEIVTDFPSPIVTSSFYILISNWRNSGIVITWFLLTFNPLPHCVYESTGVQYLSFGIGFMSW